MKKGVLIILPVAVFTLLFFASALRASASFGGFFGGKITNGEAFEIQFKEWSGYLCFVPGFSISILPFGTYDAPTSYFIPASVSSKSATIPEAGQYILGLYSGQTAIGCFLKVTPYTATTVYLPTITMYGTSK